MQILSQVPEERPKNLIFQQALKQGYVAALTHFKQPVYGILAETDRNKNAVCVCALPSTPKFV